MASKTIMDILNLRVERQEGKFGVEIEVEGQRLPKNLPIQIWRIDRDGSLKTAEAFEYVMPAPTSMKGVRQALDVLEASYIKNGSIVDESIRAGIHVHLNVQDYTIEELWTFITCYYILENLITSYCGDAREGNHFCLRSCDAEYSLFAIVQAIKSKNLKPLNTDNLRYASLNLCSLFKYGSVEFRAMRGTRDLEAVYTWVKLISDLEQGAKKFKNPEVVVQAMSAGGSMGFVHEVLGESAKLFERNDHIEQLLKEGMRRTQPIAFAVDWTTYNPVRANPFL